LTVIGLFYTFFQLGNIRQGAVVMYGDRLTFGFFNKINLRPLKSSKVVEDMHAQLRAVVSHYVQDRFQHADMQKAFELLELN
jgi:hypothetical protein